MGGSSKFGGNSQDTEKLLFRCLAFFFSLSKIEAVVGKAQA